MGVLVYLRWLLVLVGFKRSWWHLDLLPPDEDSGTERCRLYLSVPRPLQTVQRAELWGVITALQASRPVHLGVDNANVVGHISRVSANIDLARPFELLVDGDLLALVKRLVEVRGHGTTAISKVKGHAEEGLVRGGRVREQDEIGKDLADEAADFGRRRVRVDVLDVWRAFTGACGAWYPVVRDLHRFFIAIARVIANDDGKGEGRRGEGTAPDPLVWCSGAKGKRRRVVEAVRDFAMLPGHQRLWVGGWQRWPVFTIPGDDVGRWPFSVGALVKVAAFFSNLSWPTEVSDLDKWGVSYVELVILYERWAEERLQVEESVPRYRRLGCPISLSPAPLCPDVDIRNLCQYFGSMMRALRGPPGGLGRFIIPGRIGANHVVLRHIGWEKSCHGLTCGPRKSSGEKFLKDLLRLLGYPSWVWCSLAGWDSQA